MRPSLSDQSRFFLIKLYATTQKLKENGESVCFDSISKFKKRELAMSFFALENAFEESGLNQEQKNLIISHQADQIDANWGDVYKRLMSEIRSSVQYTFAKERHALDIRKKMGIKVTMAKKRPFAYPYKRH